MTPPQTPDARPGMTNAEFARRAARLAGKAAA